MLMHIKHLYKVNSLWLAIIITVAIVYLSLGNIGNFMPKLEVTFLDKIEHTLAYCILAMSWNLALLRYEKPVRIALYVFMGSFLLGLSMEVLQKVLTDYRQFDVLDLLANTLGIMFAVLIYKYAVPNSFKNYLKPTTSQVKKNVF